VCASLHPFAFDLRLARLLAIRRHVIAQSTVEKLLTEVLEGVALAAFSSALQPSACAACAAWLKGGVTINSRYCWFCAPREELPRRPTPGVIFEPAGTVKYFKELVVLAPAARHETAHDKASVSFHRAIGSACRCCREIAGRIRLPCTAV